MTGPAAKSAISNAGDGKALSAELSNHVSGYQDTRLGGVAHQFCNSQSEPKSKKTWRSTVDDLTVSEGNPNGECQMMKFTRRGSDAGRNRGNRRKTAWQTALSANFMPKGNSNGECPKRPQAGVRGTG